ncbi:hypothetical protein KGZ16_06080 [Pseudomonas aeruginosa]|uniref:hypothetical protein n=1 Tax=Pseudomonas sp. 13159349 TaxID=2662034 RepID=UPI00156D5473|nr:hypothetical protein [Pseudomonas sp. 13159349]MDC3884153.1 hypothetical protein [Pseudomonas aeruginosa]QKK99009.1 hypothetical protein GEV38_24965 [Pseudomonas sp. 13159349]
MAVDFITTNPSVLLNDFKKRIKQDEQEGKITTWDLDSDGDVTHKAEQWKSKAWMRPQVKDGKLTFTVLNPKGKEVPPEVYGFYHGHLVATFITHFGAKISSAISSGKPTDEDRVKPRS